MGRWRLIRHPTTHQPHHPHHPPRHHRHESHPRDPRTRLRPHKESPQAHHRLPCAPHTHTRTTDPPPFSTTSPRTHTRMFHDPTIPSPLPTTLPVLTPAYPHPTRPCHTCHNLFPHHILTPPGPFFCVESARESFEKEFYCLFDAPGGYVWPFTFLRVAMSGPVGLAIMVHAMLRENI